MRQSERDKYMRFGKNEETGEFYAAQYSHQLGKAVIVDTDKCLESLLVRHKVQSLDNSEVIDPLKLLSERQKNA
ncbi:MAG: hypothetical protein AB1861_08865 [Cyanobacteriota bacterium]